MDSWAIDAAERDSEREQLAILRMKQAIQDRDIFTVKINEMKARWRSLLRSKAEEFNNQPGKRNTLSVEADAGTCRVWIIGRPLSISGTFSSSTLRLAGKHPIRFNEEWRIELTPDRMGLSLYDTKDAPVTLDEIANAVIDALLVARWQ